MMTSKEGGPTPDSEKPFLSAKSTASGRSAIFEDDGYSGWLYLTAPGEKRPVADCFVYSCVAPVERLEPGPLGRNAPPLLARKFASTSAVRSTVSQEMLQLQFSENGESVAILIAGEPWAFIAQGEKRGYSRSLSASGPFGEPWNEDRYQELF